jgi:hypothetical protein
MNSENVKIPLALFNQTLNVLEYVYKSDAVMLCLAPDFIAYFESVLWDLRRKELSLELRAAYSKIVAAKTETARHYARIDYLRLKQEIEPLS